MASADLEHFQIDCRQKESQIRMLQSMRVNRDDQIMNGLANLVQPWKSITDPNTAYQRREVQTGRTNWLINQNLQRLAYDCL